MVGFFNRAEGRVDCLIKGALPEAFLNRCLTGGIELRRVESIDDFTLRVSAGSAALKKLRSAAAKSGCTLELVGSGGLSSLGRLMLHRAFPAAVLALLLGLVLASRLFIWDIEVEGNETVSAGKILDALAECGVTGGTFWPNITSDNLRSEVLVRMPELSWITVNINGSRAQVIVRERVAKPEMMDDSPVDIVAEKTGFITAVSALDGAAAVKPGQAVGPGDLLISGIMQSSFSPPRLVHSWGSVEAQTYYELNTVMPEQAQVKTYTGEKKSRWALIIGKNRYNFYSNSSITDTNCDKITWEAKAEVKGLFSIPVKLVKETSVYYECSSQPRDALLAGQGMERQLRGILDESIGTDGEVLESRFSYASGGGLLSVCLRSRCSEDIARAVPMSAARQGEFLLMKGQINDGENDRS